MSEAVRYLCVARLAGIDAFFFWESSDDGVDRVTLDDDGFVRTFSSEVAARASASRETHAMSPNDAAVYDLDAIEAWCKSSTDVLSCSELLKAWNLFSDLPLGENLFRVADARANVIYDKLFAGCNFQSITPPGEHYVPVWNASETAILKRLLLLGLAEFRARLH